MLREVISHDWFTIFLVLGLSCIAISKYLFGSRFKDFIFVVGNSKYLKIHARDQRFIDTFDSLLFFNLIISISIFAHYLYSSSLQNLKKITFYYYLLSFLDSFWFIPVPWQYLSQIYRIVIYSLFCVFSFIHNYYFYYVLPWFILESYISVVNTGWLQFIMYYIHSYLL